MEQSKSVGYKIINLVRIQQQKSTKPNDRQQRESYKQINNS